MATLPAFKKGINKQIKLIAALALLLAALLAYAVLRERTPLLTHAQANTLYTQNKIRRIVLDKPYLYILTVDGKRYKIYENAINKKAFYTRYLVEVKEDESYWFDVMLLLIIAGAFVYMFATMRNMQRQRLAALKQGASGEGASDPILPQVSHVTFDDVAGIDEVKEELEEIIDFLKHPQKYAALGVRLPKGVLLAGPPGVGKTHIAKAVAGEAGVPFFYQSGASFVHIYVGMGAKRVSELFAQAKRHAPAIVFIDEIDAVGKSRGGLHNDEREATLNQLLTEMDGFESGSGVIVMAATNKIEMLDEALLRPGRFDRRIHVPLPDPEGRRRILELYLAQKPHDVDIDAVVAMTVGFSAAALETLVNEAALFALRRGAERITTADMEAVREKVLLGKRRIQVFDEEERRVLAWYQAARAMTATWFDMPFERIGLIHTQMPVEQKALASRSVLMQRIKVLLAGSVACEMRFGERYTVAKEDIAAAKTLVHDVVYEYAMADGFRADSAAEKELLRQSVEELHTLLKSLHKALEAAERHLLEYEHIDQETCREMLRALF